MESESNDHQHQAEAVVCAGTYQSDYTFKEEDVPGLAEALAEVAYKWEEIAVALRLSKTVIEECREKGSKSAMKLYNVLHAWVVGQHLNAAPAYKENLKTALASPLVQHPQLASELEYKLKTSLSLQNHSTSHKKSIFHSDIREVLVKQYSRYPEVPKGSWPPVVSKKFINLALIETSGQPLESDYSIRGDADDVLAIKKQVQYENIFGVYEEAGKILILGHPGSGKTTLVHKLGRDWSAGKALQGAELVFLVSLRVLSSKKCDLSQLVRKYFYDKQDLQKVLGAIKQVKGKNVCFIFDGFDEYCPQDKEESDVFQLLNQKYLEHAMIIVTSRPAAASHSTHTAESAEAWHTSYKKIEVFGFSKNQIMEYVDKFPFSSSSSVNEVRSLKLRNFLSSHPGVLDLCYLPVNCAIVCFLYNSKPDHFPDTQTQIYALFTRLIIIRQLTSRDISRQLDTLEDLEGQTAEDFKALCSLAFDMTTQSQQVITRGPASSDEAHSLGLVTTDITAELSGYKNSYSFLHLTLQEFLAAYHLSRLNQEEQMSLIEKYSKAVHMLTVWKFYFGLVNFEVGLDRAEKLFASVDLISDSGVNTDIFKLQCSYEAKQATVVRLVSSEELEFSGTLSNYDMSAITYVMSVAATQGNPVTSVMFLNWGPGDDRLLTFLDGLQDRALQNVKEFNVSSADNVTVSDIKVLGNKMNFRRMQQPNSEGLRGLKYLTLNGACVTDEHVRALTAGLDGNYVMKSLNLSFCSISAAGVSEIMRADCQLQHLDLSGNHFGDEGAEAVARGLRKNLTLKSINLSFSNIGVTGVKALGRVLQGNIFCLNLNLSCNSFTFSHHLHNEVSTDSYSSSLSDIVKDSNPLQGSEGDPVVMHEEVSQVPHFCVLENLNLCRNHCSGDFLTIVSYFKLLSHLDLSRISMDLPGVLTVLDYVANSDNCRQLVHLDLPSVMTGRRRGSSVSFNEDDESSSRIVLRFCPGIMVELSDNLLIDKITATNLLQTMKKYNRISAVCLNYCNITKKEFTDLKKTYQCNEKSCLLM